MSKHTNGLQILKPNKSFVAVGPEGGLATAMFIAGAGKPPNEETLANARLYVAAPAMLDAIKTAEEALSEILDNRTHLDLDRLDRKMLENARAELQGAMKESVMRKRIQWIGDLEICHNPKADPHMAYEIFTSCHLIGAFSTLERAIAYAEGKARQRQVRHDPNIRRRDERRHALRPHRLQEDWQDTTNRPFHKQPS